MLQTSGAIAISDVAVELGLASTANLTLDDSRVRKLAKLETAGTAIGLADLYGKANFQYSVAASPTYSIGTWRGPAADGGTYRAYSGGWIVTVDSPSGIVITQVQLYNADGTAGTLLTVTDGLPGYVSTTANAAYPAAARPSGMGNNQVALIGTGKRANGSYARWYYTIPKAEIIDSNGNRYMLEDYPNLQVWYDIN